MQKISIEQAISMGDVLQLIGGSRRPYSVMYHSDVAANIPEVTVNVSMVANIQKRILESPFSVINLSYHELPSDQVIQLIDEIIVPVGHIPDNELIKSRFKKTSNGQYDIWYQTYLTTENMHVFKTSKALVSLLETVTEPGWEPWHKCHFYPEHNLVLRVLWDRREILNAWVIDKDSADVLVQSAHDNDTLIRYLCFEKDLEILEPIHSLIDYMIKE